MNDKFTQKNQKNFFDGIMEGIASTVEGSFLNFGGLNANDPLNIRPTPSGQLGRQIGKDISTSHSISKLRKQRNSEALAKKLMSDSGVDDLLSKIQNHNAIVQSLIDTIDSPEASLGEATIQGLKQQLLAASEEISGGAQTSTILKSLISSLTSTNAPAAEIFERRLREYKNLGANLVHPTFQAKSTDPFFSIDSGKLNENAKQRFGSVQQKFNNQKYKVELVQFNENNNQQAQYARVSRRTRNGSRFTTLIPVDLNANKANVGYRIVRTGEESTPYRMDRAFIDGEKLQKIDDSYSISNIKKAGAFIDAEDYLIQNMNGFFEHGGDFDKNSYNALIRDHAESEHRHAGANTALGQHIRKVSGFHSNTARIVNLENTNVKTHNEILRKMAESDDFDLGVGADKLGMNEINGRKSSQVLFKSGSVISSLESGFGSLITPDRFLEPVIARPEQAAHRASQSSMLTRGMNTISSNAPINQRLGAGQRPILWSDAVSGGTNKATVLDVGGSKFTDKWGGVARGKIYEGLEGSGQAFSLANETSVRASVIPLLNPTEHGNLVSPLLNTVMESNKPITLTTEEIKKNGGFIGIGQSGTKFLNEDPQMTKMSLEVLGVSKGSAKSTLRLLATQEREHTVWKGFGRMVKSTIATRSREAIDRMLDPWGQSSKSLASLYSIDDSHMVFTSGEMLKKSPLNMMRQLSTGFMLSTKSEQNVLEKITEEVASGKRNGFGLLTKNPMELAVASVLHGFKDAGETDVTKIGMTLATVYNRGLKNEDSWLKGQASRLAIDQGGFEGAVFHAFGADMGRAVLKQASSGLTMAMDTLALGEGPGDWGMARGSMEPRHVAELQKRLRLAGVSEDKISDFVVSMYQEKMNSGSALASASNLADMSERMLKGIGLMDPAEQTVPTVKVKDLLTQINDQDDLSTVMKQDKYAKGLILDFDDSTFEFGDQFSYASRQAFNSTGQMYLAGSNLIDEGRDSVIKTVDGAIDQTVAGEYEKFLNKFGSMLSNGNNPMMAHDDLVASMEESKKELLSLTMQSVDHAAKGKWRGSRNMVAQTIDMEYGSGLTEGQQSRIQGIFKKTQGDAVFVTDEGFLSQQKDVLNRKGGAVEVAHNLKRFFLGQLKGGQQYTGVHQAMARNPVLDMGNIFFAQVFRNVDQVDNDTVLSEILNTDWGKKAASRFKNEDIKTWQDIENSKNVIAKRQFFTAFARNLTNFYQSEGGGIVSFPKMNQDFTFGKNKRKVTIDMGLPEQGFGDSDGDNWTMFDLGRKQSSRIARQLSLDTAENYRRDQLEFKIRKKLYGEEAKASLKNIKSKVMTPQEIEYMDALKEKGLKESTGRVDVALNEIKSIVYNSDMDDRSKAFISGLFGPIEEHSTIKSKKLEHFAPFADQIAHGIDQLVKNGDESAFRYVFENVLFSGSEALQGEGMAYYDADGNEMGKLNLKSDLDQIIKAVQTSRSTRARFSEAGTANQRVAAIANAADPGQAFDDIMNAGNSLSTGVVAGARENGSRQTANAFAGVSKMFSSQFSNLNKKHMGAIAMGVGATAIAMNTVFGNDGYDAEPLDLGYNDVSPKVKDAIATHQLLKAYEPTGNTLQSIDPSPGVRPIEAGVTYMHKPNSYQTEMSTSNSYSFRAAFGYAQSAPGAFGNVSGTINDTRMPISSHYIDRVSGEY